MNLATYKLQNTLGTEREYPYQNYSS